MTVSSHRDPDNQSITAHRHPNNPHITVASRTPPITETLCHEAAQQPLRTRLTGTRMIPPQEVPTLRQLWARGQQVILSYEDEASVRRHAELWPGIPYWWGNKVKPRDLIHYLERMKSCGRPGKCLPCTGTPGHMHVLGQGAGFGFKWRNGTGHVRGR